MSHEIKDKIEDPHFVGEIELYGDPGIATFDAKVPKFLLAVYIIMPIWGMITLYYFWNGSIGWLDRGYWHQLQIAANTAYPKVNQNAIFDQKQFDDEEKKQTPSQH